MKSFLSKINSFLKIAPSLSSLPNDITSLIEPKCTVLYYPIEVPDQYMYTERVLGDVEEERLRDQLMERGPLHIVWPHRWYMPIYFINYFIISICKGT